MYAKNNEKSRDPHSICRRSVENRFPRTLKTTPPRYPLDTVYMLCSDFIQSTPSCSISPCILMIDKGCRPYNIEAELRENDNDLILNLFHFVTQKLNT